MFPFTPLHLLLTILPLFQYAIAAPGPAGSSTNATTTPQPPTPNFSLGAKVPFPGQGDFALLPMLFLTCDGLFTFAPHPYRSSSPSGVKISGTLKIQVEGSPELPASAFQIRHAMWALWLGAVTQLDERDYRPGIFVMDVKSGSGAGQVTRSVGSIIYRNDNRPATTGMGMGVGNGTVDAGGSGVGAIEPVVAGAGVDVTSRRRMLRRGQDGSTDDDTAIITTKRTTRQWPSLPPPPTQPAILSFPGFPPPNTTITTPPPTNNFYNIQITGTSQLRISLTSAFTTVYETMVSRASLPDRDILLNEWFYTSQRSGYVFGIHPPEGYPVGISPPFEAMMGAMANLPRALQVGRISVEVTFDVLDGESGEKVLQGFLVLDK